MSLGKLPLAKEERREARKGGICWFNTSSTFWQSCEEVKRMQLGSEEKEGKLLSPG